MRDGRRCMSVERYEQLRSDALEGGASGFKLGLGAARAAWGRGVDAGVAAAAPDTRPGTDQRRLGARATMSSSTRWRAWRWRACAGR